MVPPTDKHQIVKQEIEEVLLIEEENLQEKWVKDMAQKTILTRSNDKPLKIQVYVKQITNQEDLSSSDSEMDVEHKAFVDRLMQTYKAVSQFK